MERNELLMNSSYVKTRELPMNNSLVIHGQK